ncbi:MAG: hypothetical protein J0M16_11130, partial [Gammaproteobacteria bacterium]|nr:hypothetical protein [Gammaproteobacteria bacterium]
MNDTARSADLLSRAAAAYQQGAMDDARALAEEAERLAPSSASVLELKGAIALAQGRAAAGAEALTLAAERSRVQIGHENLKLRLGQATALEIVGDHQGAVGALEAALAAMLRQKAAEQGTDAIDEIQERLAE